MDLAQLIKTRRSIRKFKNKTIPKAIIDKIIEAGHWAPSGLNNQPWRFRVIDKEKKESLAKYTHYSHIIKSANKLILIFLDKESSYDHDKDLMAIGACIQNMLLYLHYRKLGACWLGEILNKKTQVQEFLKIPKSLELEGVLAIGYPLKTSVKSKRKLLKSLFVR